MTFETHEGPGRECNRVGASNSVHVSSVPSSTSTTPNSATVKRARFVPQLQPFEEFERETLALLNGTAVIDGEGVKQLPAAAVIAAVYEIEGTITQDGVARIFARQYSNRLRFDHNAGAWFQWTGERWRRDEKDLAFHFVRLLARAVSEGANDAAVREARKRSFAGGVESFAEKDPVFAVTSDDWDRDALLLGTPSGTVDLRTGLTRRADPADGITKLTAVAPAPSAACPRWLQFLNEATGGDAGLIRFLQQWCGYCLTGLTREHALVFVYGPGGNGKSVFLNVLTGILGDYAATAAMDTFTASKGDKHPTDLAMLRGARVVTASETEEGGAWAEARLKSVTGGDPVTARFMRQDFFTFRPTFKLTIVGNHRPTLRSVDDAARRRFNIVPFIRKPERPDRELEEKLRDEWPAILRWMLDGCLDWQANGLSRPDVVKAATEEYFSTQDTFSLWLDERCIVDQGNSHRKATSQELFGSWSDFAKLNNEPIGTLTSFGDRMDKLSFKKN